MACCRSRKEKKTGTKKHTINPTYAKYVICSFMLENRTTRFQDLFSKKKKIKKVTEININIHSTLFSHQIVNFKCLSNATTFPLRMNLN